MYKSKKAKNTSIRIPAGFIYLIIAVYSLAIYFCSWGTNVALPHDRLPIGLYSNQAGDNLKETFIKAIGDAKESIYCLIYSLNDEEIIQAFKNKAEEGVEVFIVTDPVATQDAAVKLGPKVTVVSRRQKGLMHNKLLAIDKKVSWLGSANFTRDSLALHANIVMGISNPQLACAIEEKAKTFHEKGRKVAPLTLTAKNQTLELSFLPDDGNALHKLIKQLQGAQKSIKVAMFTFTHPDLINTLVAAHKRGVDVEVVIDSDSSRKTSSQAYKRFCQEKMQVFTSRRVGLLHEKMAIIDDTCLVMGSANWTKAAFSQNSENISFLSPLTQDQQAKLKTFWNKTLQEAKLSN